MGHTVISETESPNAMQRLAETPVDLVVLDVMLPGMSGFEICRQIPRNPDSYTLPVLMLSGMNDEEEIRHGLEQGADDYVTKPFDLRSLSQRIEALLRFNSDHPTRDTMTAMLSGDSMKREVQRRTIEGEVFGLAYAEILNVREFGFRCSADARAKAIRHFGRTIEQVGEALKSDAFACGHMGGGHFVCILPSDRAEQYCNHVRKVWQEHLRNFYESIGQLKAFEIGQQKGPGPDSIPILDVLFCVTHRHANSATTPKRMFDTLTQMRSRAISDRVAGVFLDRRTAPAAISS